MFPSASVRDSVSGLCRDCGVLRRGTPLWTAFRSRPNSVENSVENSVHGGRYFFDYGVPMEVRYARTTATVENSVENARIDQFAGRDGAGDRWSRVMCPSGRWSVRWNTTTRDRDARERFDTRRVRKRVPAISTDFQRKTDVQRTFNESVHRRRAPSATATLYSSENSSRWARRCVLFLGVFCFSFELFQLFKNVFIFSSKYVKF